MYEDNDQLLPSPRRIIPIVGSYRLPSGNDRIPLDFYRTHIIRRNPGEGPTIGCFVLESYRILTSENIGIRQSV